MENNEMYVNSRGLMQDIARHHENMNSSCHGVQYHKNVDLASGHSTFLAAALTILPDTHLLRLGSKTLFPACHLLHAQDSMKTLPVEAHNVHNVTLHIVKILIRSQR